MQREKLYNLTRLMYLRSTSYAKDEIVCLMSLLRWDEENVDAVLNTEIRDGKNVDADEKERIERRLSRIKFIDTEKYFPRDFVFGTGAKMEEIGY